jgi:serine/threonine-protein kinase
MRHEPQESDPRLVDEVFSRALELDGSGRSSYLQERCAGDAGLRRRVERLLAAAESGVDPLAQTFDTARDRLLRAMLADGEEPEEELGGQRIGHWLIERRVARGGLATVYLAHRDDGEFEQDVAFKVLRRGLDTDDVVSRFRAERQILSSLEHPSIARILDGGALPDGRPYLVLEFVAGLPITAWCEARDADLRTRLRLMITVLRALQHAHARLVVHRDVKPSNILVTDDGAVKLLDFGIAKLLDPVGSAKAPVLTRTGVALLTPGYGSPEQHAGRPVTTASDIYQAGLVLFELLTGRRPFDGNPVSQSFLLPRPSELLRDTRRFQAVRGDLDAIVAKATHVDPEQRYGSAEEMVLDLQRLLDGRPVLARPDSVGYRLRKLAARRPWLLPVVTLAAVGLVAYIVTLTVYSGRLEREQRLAAAARQFMEDLFRSPDPYAPADPERGAAIRVVDALEIGQRRIRAELQDQPELHATLLGSIADVYASLDQYAQATVLREEALALEQSLYGAESPRVLASLRELGGHYSMAGDLARADALLDRQLELAGRLYPRGSAGLALSQVAWALHRDRQGDPAGSRAMLLEAIEPLRADPAAHGRLLVQVLITLEQQRSLVAEPLGFDPLEEAEAVARAAFGEDSLQLALVRVRRASSLTNRGEYAASEQEFLAAIPVLEDRLGPDHGSTLGALNNLGYLYHGQGDLAGAERIHRELLERKLALHGPAHRAVGDSYQNLAAALTHQGRYDESLPLHRQAYEVFRQVLNDDNYVISVPLLSIAYVQLQRGEPLAAEEAAREALVRLQAVTAAPQFQGVARCLVGVALESQGRVAEGAALVSESHALMVGASLPEPYPALCRLPGRQDG